MQEAALPAPGSGLPLTPMVEQARGLLQQNAIAQARQLCLDVLESGARSVLEASLPPAHPAWLK
jgi:hypothetical protein